MNILFSGDWQLDSSNLDTAEVMVKEIIDICKKEQITTLINLGDVKHKYSPIEGRVLNFGVDVCSEFRRNGITQHILLGNHDRYGLHSDLVSWLPVLEKAGAIIHTVPERVRILGKVHISFLPFTTNIARLKKRAASLAKKETYKTILAFHQDVKYCGYNVLQKSISKLTINDLHADKYMFAIGGHIHLQQNVKGNVWYAGSPFPMDWGEANQRKGYLMVDTDGEVVVPIESKIPRLYDTTWPGFEESKPTSWKGATVRIKVPCVKGDNVELKTADAEKKAAKEFVGASLVVVPKFKEDEVESIDLEGNEDKLLRRYLKKNCSENYIDDVPRMLPYLTYRLKQAGISFGKAKKIEFLKAEAHNFLSYQHLEIDFKESGVRVVTAKNRDWPGRSNGSGKTNYVQIIAVAFCGTTFKGQSHDRWYRRGAKKKGYVDLTFKVDDVLYRVLRTRKPQSLKIFDKDGKDISQGNRPTEVQKQLEKLTGFSWETLSAVYVDQRTQNPLLTGTDRERKIILEKIQRIERYELASKAIKADIVNLDTFSHEITTKKESADSELVSLREHLMGVNSLIVDKDAVKARYVKLKHELQHVTSVEKQVLRLKTLLEAKKAANLEVQRHFIHQGVLSGDMSRVLGRIKKLSGLEGQSCPTCEQQVQKKHVSKIKVELYKQKQRIRSKQQDTLSAYKDAELKKDVVDDEIKVVENEIYHWRIKKENKVRDLSELRARILLLKKQQGLASVTKRKIVSLKTEIARYKEVVETLRKEKDVLLYCMSILSRKGLPAFLNQYICPQLNNYAEHYSNLFSDGQIKVRFDVVDGDFEVKVLNLTGGESVEDQSEGETRIASLITSFAQRDVISPCNVMILDEPGQGLDSANAQLLAQKIAGLGNKIGTLILISHNPYMIAELSDCKQVRIEKKKGVSYVAA